MNSFHKIISIVLGMLLLFFVITFYVELQFDGLLQLHLEYESKEFLDDVREHGYISKERYTSFLQNISNSSILFDVDLMHKRLCYEPEYRFPSVEEILRDRKYQGENEYHVRNVLSMPDEVKDDVTELPHQNHETNETVMRSARVKEADQAHIHSDLCYAGHIHKGEKCFLIKHTHGANCKHFFAYMDYVYTCPYCKRRCAEQQFANCWDETIGKVMNVASREHFSHKCCVCGGYISDAEITAKYCHAYSCGYSIDLDGDGYEDQVDGEQEYRTENDSLWTEKEDYINGCYTYHRHKNLSKNTNIGGIVNPHVIITFSRQIYLEMYCHGDQSQCFYPRFITIRFDKKNSYAEFYKEITYVAYITEKGNLVYRTSGTSYGNADMNYVWAKELTAQEMGAVCVNKTYKYLLMQNVPKNDQFYSDISMYSVKEMAEDRIQVCKREEGWSTNCGQQGDGTCMCDQIIKSIEATHPVQTLYSGENLITTLRVTYLDGSERTVIGQCEFQTNQVVTDYPVQLYYYGYRSATEQIKFLVPIRVTLTACTRMCENGHTYHLNADGSDPGCPYCRAWLRTLSVEYPRSGRMEITTGTTLKQNGLVLRAEYLNGKVEYISSGYVDNLDLTYVGAQRVTIGYKGKYVTLNVTSICKKKKCMQCGNVYSLFPDGSDPGCPFCESLIPVFIGNVLTYYDVVYMDEIQKQLERDGVYYLKKNDQIRIILRNQSKSMAMNLCNLFMHHSHTIYVYESGIVRDEGGNKR